MPHRNGAGKGFSRTASAQSKPAAVRHGSGDTRPYLKRARLTCRKETRMSEKAKNASEFVN